MSEAEMCTVKTNYKYLIPQIYAACVATSFHLLLSSSLAFPTFLIPELEDPNSDIKVTISQSSWTATIATMTMTLSALLNGIFIHKFGALNTIKLASIPGVCGWVMVANATNITTLLIGRFLTGIAVALANASTCYATEVTRPDIRSSVLNTIPFYVSAGLVLSNLLGYFFHWRTLAWINNIYIIIPTILLTFLPESPIWLIFKGRNEDAKAALRRFNKYLPNKEEETEKQFQELIKDHRKKMVINMPEKKRNLKRVFIDFMKPTGYKPMLLSTTIFFFQQCSGIYIILVHTIIFFKNIKIDIIDINMIPALLSIVRLFTNIITIFTMKYFNKRSLILISALGMSICITISGIFTFWIQEGTSVLTWVPLVLINFYVVFSIFGIVPIPWMITSELFPTNIRGFGQGFTAAVGNGFLSLALQNYRYLEKSLGGTYAIQFFFAVMLILATVFIYFFFPETHNKKLIEIEEYFESNWIYKNKSKIKKNDEILKTELEVIQI